MKNTNTTTVMTEKHRAMQARVIPKESSNARKITTLGMQ
jgi:hypothetical protein